MCKGHFKKWGTIHVCGLLLVIKLVKMWQHSSTLSYLRFSEQYNTLNPSLPMSMYLDGCIRIFEAYRVEDARAQGPPTGVGR